LHAAASPQRARRSAIDGGSVIERTIAISPRAVLLRCA
jgi:hypothetical protein